MRVLRKEGVASMMLGASSDASRAAAVVGSKKALGASGVRFGKASLVVPRKSAR